MKANNFRWHFLFGGYVFTALALNLYSYTQVDLNLTISKVTIWQSIQKFLQHIGYLDRPLSTIIYLILIACLFFLYGLLLRWIGGKCIERRGVWRLIFVVTAILLFSYPAFSYDIFNYIFAAKEVLLYHKNPYLVTPQQFAPVDQWVLFMRWVHLPSAYTPLWNVLTLPAYLLGFGYFLPILFSIKSIIVASYLLCALLIEKSLNAVESKHALFGLAVFALNPLVLVEAVVSPHNDMLMMAAAVGAYYLFIRKQTVNAYFLWSISVALKLVTIVLLPLFLVGWKRFPAFVLMTIGLLIVVSQREILSWYFLWIIPFVALMPTVRWLTTFTVGASAGLLLRYVPYLYYGNWNDPVPSLKWWLTIVPIGLSVLILFTGILRRRA